MLSSPRQRLLDRLEQQQRDMLHWASSLSDRQLSFRPSAAEWSVLDVLTHLVKVEQEFATELRRGLASPTRSPRLPERVRCVIVLVVMNSPIKVKVPAAVADRITPDLSLSLGEAADSWISARGEIIALAAASPVPLKGGVLRHPISGWLALDDTLRVLFAHTRHHRYQLDRLRARAG